MSDQISKAVIAEIDKSLPSMVGEQLKTRLLQADEAESKVIKLEFEIAQMAVKTTERDQIISSYQRQESKFNDLVDRESKLVAKEHAFAVREAVLKVREDMANTQVTHSLAVLDKIFRERSVFHAFNASIPIPTPGNPYGQGNISGSVTTAPGA